jgi:uncharacterized protein YecE (DUF72 family)
MEDIYLAERKREHPDLTYEEYSSLRIHTEGKRYPLDYSSDEIDKIAGTLARWTKK